MYVRMFWDISLKLSSLDVLAIKNQSPIGNTSILLKFQSPNVTKQNNIVIYKNNIWRLKNNFNEQITFLWVIIRL